MRFQIHLLPRRFRVKAGNAAFFLVALVLVSSGSFADEANWSRDDAAHLLRRAGFGGTPVQIDRLFAMDARGRLII